MSEDAEFDKCVYKSSYADGNLSIRCRNGRWSVSGPDAGIVKREAMLYFALYRRYGEYDNLLGRAAGVNASQQEQAV